MNKTFFGISTALGILSLSLPLFAMEPPERWGHPCSSVSIRAEISPALKQNVFDSFKEGFDAINGAQNKNSVIYKWNGTKVGNQFRHQTTDKVTFKHSNPNSYHVSLCIVHPSEKGIYANQKIGDKQQLSFLELARFHLQPQTMIQEVQNAGNCFQFLTMVHSYNMQGEQVNKTYQDQLGNLAVDFPNGISNVHFAMRHGTWGKVKDRVEKCLTPAINSQKQLFKNPYEGKFDEFIGHITIGKMDKTNAGAITALSTRFRQEEYQIIFDVHATLKGAFDHDKAKFSTKGAVSFDRISMRGLVFEDNKCTGDILLKNDISK